MNIGATGIVVALASEADTLTSRAAKPDQITALGDDSALWLSGMGPDAARRAAEGLADAGASALAVFGVAGALHPQLRNGALFCPERVMDEEGRDFATDASWCADVQRTLAEIDTPLRTEGALLSVAAPLLTVAAKQTAHQRYAALAVDMESAAVAAVAQTRGLPFIVMRAIVDEANDMIPSALNDSVDAWGRPRPLHLMAALCRHPSVWGELPRLYSRMQRATQALRAAAKAVGPTLGWHR
ncbi:purine and other phosphorylase-like protein, family 1 [Dyella sp. 2HG41-7]|uniref:phosphorylase family protein n=1 Tax=Dyella sp. 2HG41-7 TaxID=2883239 RepID=UPI001F348364|nr:purine and other phosphorylase-like protein, family 1 [Dyella sp. 2HG41-7]